MFGKLIAFTSTCFVASNNNNKLTNPLFPPAGGAPGAWSEEERKEVVVQRVDVPNVVGLGEDVELECHYEISGNLYSIKWYLNDREFFRYQPHEETAIMIFERPGVNVNVSTTLSFLLEVWVSLILVSFYRVPLLSSAISV